MFRFLGFVRGAASMGVTFAAALTLFIVVLKWRLPGSDLRDAMIETVLRGWPLLGFIIGLAFASVRALYGKADSAAYGIAIGTALAQALVAREQSPAGSSPRTREGSTE